MMTFLLAFACKCSFLVIIIIIITTTTTTTTTTTSTTTTTTLTIIIIIIFIYFFCSHGLWWFASWLLSPGPDPLLLETQCLSQNVCWS